MTLNTSKISVPVITAEKEEIPTVLSQSNLSYYIQPFWDSLLQQQEQHTAFAKPIGGSSPDSYHENHPAVIPIGGPRMAIDDLITAPTPDSFQQFMLLSHQFNSNIHGNSMVIKDDVFLAQPSILSRDVLYPSWNTLHDHDDTASLSSHSSLSSSQHSDKLTTSPCLSPVTSPTNFLYNHEPLFEGGIMEDLGNKKNISDEEFEEEEYDDLSSVLTDNSDDKQQQMIRRLSTVSDDLDWFKLLDAFRADGDLAETDDQLSDCTNSSFDHLSSEDEDYIEPIKKRKRIEEEPVLFRMYELNISDHPIHQYPIKSSTKNVPSNLSQKRRKKSKATSFTPRYKKYQKKKTDFTNTLTVSPIKKKEEPESKESISSTTRCQLIESVVEKDNKTVFQHLTEASIDWCRYCGTTEGVNWRPGPWGKRTLCK